MKNLSLLFISGLFILLSCAVQASIITVSNNPDSPGQYTSLQAAIDAAAHYDTILVAGSATSYGSITFGKPLVLIGAGYHNPYGNNTTVGSITLTRQTYYVSASGSKIMGFIISGLVFYGYYDGGTPSSMSITNVDIERCQISSQILFGYTGDHTESFSDMRIGNCYILNALIFSNGYYQNNNNHDFFNNVYFFNNIFVNIILEFPSNSKPLFTDLSKVFFRNNIFLSKSNNIFHKVKRLVLENNIFYAAEPQGCTECVFTKNLTYMCLNNNVPGTGNMGSGNLVNQDPQFVNVPPTGGFSWGYDYHLQPGSPGKDAGTDGSDIGIYGGMLPFEVGANPYIPQVTETTLPSGSSVPAGGTLHIHFKARKQN